MAAVFPEPEYKLQQVTPGHPIWRMEEKVRPDSPYVGQLWSVEYGCRTSVVYSTEDLSCYWELAQPGRPTTYPEAVEERIDDALAVGVNVLTYATNREPKGKEQSFDAAAGRRRRRPSTATAASSKSPSSTTAAAATTRRGRW